MLLSMKKKLTNSNPISSRQLNSIAEIVKDAGVAVFSGVTVGLILDPKPKLAASVAAIGFSFLLWYINLKIINEQK
jgi:hypothetical protein